jgi:monoamine oxidase/SAM-dependent methyltransferase
MSVLDVALVGGGPGGLMTARFIGEKMPGMCRTTLFEASERLGGKVRTGTFGAAPARYEAGVAEIYDYSMLGHDPLKELITSVCGLETVPMDGGAVVLDGEFHNDLQAIRARYGPKTVKAIETFRTRCARMLTREQYYEGTSKVDNDHPWARISQRTLLEQEVADPVARRFFRVLARSDIASEPHVTNGLNALKNMLMDVPGYIGVYAIAGGNERLIDALAARVDADIRLGHRITRIGRTEDGRYRLTFSVGGRTETRVFDMVVVSLPHNWLSTVVFEGEALDAALQDHIAHFDRPAHYLRLSVLFRSPFWRRHVTGSWFMTESFGGCCVYDEGSRLDVGGNGVLNWLIAGSDCLAWANTDPAQILAAALDGLPAVVRAEAREQVLEVKVHPFLASVNAIPGGLPVRSARRNHVPEPDQHPGLLLTGDYLFDSTLNGVLDSADFATDQLLSRALAVRYANGLARSEAARAPAPVVLPPPSTRIDRAYFDRYRGVGPYHDVWRRFSDPDHLAELVIAVWGLQRRGRILVAGSASGELVGALRERGFKAWGIENNRRILARTTRALRRFNREGSVTRLPFDDASFDVVLDSCLCHVPEHRVRRAIRELRRVTRGGLFFGSVTADLSPPVLDRYDLLRGVRTLATSWEWSERFLAAGFELAVAGNAPLDALWNRTVAAGRGPGAWFEEPDSLRCCFYTRRDAGRGVVAPRPTPGTRLPIHSPPERGDRGSP